MVISVYRFLYSYIFKYVRGHFLSYRIKVFAPLTDKDISKRSQSLYSIAESIEILIIECIHARFQVMAFFVEYVDAIKKIYFFKSERVCK